MHIQKIISILSCTAAPQTSKIPYSHPKNPYLKSYNKETGFCVFYSVQVNLSYIELVSFYLNKQTVVLRRLTRPIYICELINWFENVVKWALTAVFNLNRAGGGVLPAFGDNLLWSLLTCNRFCLATVLLRIGRVDWYIVLGGGDRVKAGLG